MMSKRHFIELADMIRRFTPVINGNPGEYGYAMDYGRTQQHETLKEALADYCARQNPRFDRERWLGYISGECGPSGGTTTRECHFTANGIGGQCALHARSPKSRKACDTMERK